MFDNYKNNYNYEYNQIKRNNFLKVLELVTINYILQQHRFQLIIVYSFRPLSQWDLLDKEHFYVNTPPESNKSAFEI